MRSGECEKFTESKVLADRSDSEIHRAGSSVECRVPGDNGFLSLVGRNA